MVVAVEEKSDLSSSSPSTGQLVIIGGAEDKRDKCSILREFVRLAGGRKAKIAIMTVATGRPGEVGAEYREVFERLGIESIQIVDTERREDASYSRNLNIIKEATGVFFTGGDQARITDILKDTDLDKLLHQRFERGLIIGGTSAGAAMMSDVMIADGETEISPRIEIVSIEPGMNFLPGVIIDQHFAQRGRLNRLISALIQEPAVLGFGIDENTAIVVKGSEIEIIGEGAVTIVDTSNLTHSNADTTLQDEPLAICGAKIHILPNGYRFDLKQRECVCS